MAAGGAIGAAARYAVEEAIRTPAASFPLNTFAINTSGCLVLGVLLTLVVERWPPSTYLRPFFATGVVGAYTTWSTFAVQADQLGQHGRLGLAAGYAAASLAAGWAAVVAGVALARRWPGGRRGR